MKFQKPLLKALMKKSFISILTEAPDNDNYEGVVVALTDSYVVLAEEVDYQFDGFNLIPRCNIRGYRQSDVEEFTQKLMSFNGDINDLIIPAWIEQSKSVEELFSKININPAT